MPARKSSNTTAQWSPEFGEKILREVSESSDPLSVALANNVRLVQIYKYIARQRYVAAHQMATEDRTQFLDAASKKLAATYACLLERAHEQALTCEDADVVKLQAETRRGLESVGVFGASERSAVRQTQINVFGNVNLRDLTDEQLAEHAEQIAGQLRDSANGSSGTTAGDIVGEEASGREPTVVVLPGDGSIAQGALPKAHGVLSGGETPPGEVAAQGKPNRRNARGGHRANVPPDGAVPAVVGRKKI
ncbi:MAG: hypothetical protein Q8P12_01510 [bacterium]|nr:hypothetical protein [bacterium]